MNVKRDSAAEFAIRTLSPTDRQKVTALLDHLANWENDEQIRKASKASTYKNVYVLTTSDDISISFNLDYEKHEITVLYIVKPSRFVPANQVAG